MIPGVENWALHTSVNSYLEGVWAELSRGEYIGTAEREHERYAPPDLGEKRRIANFVQLLPIPL